MPAIFSFVVVIPGINGILGVTGILAASYNSQEKYPEHVYGAAGILLAVRFIDQLDIETNQIQPRQHFFLERFIAKKTTGFQSGITAPHRHWAAPSDPRLLLHP